MKGILALGMLVALAAFVPRTGVAADACASGCGSEVAACRQSGRTSMVACRAACRESAAPADLRGCMHDCRVAFRDDRASCKDDLLGCLDACRPDAPVEAAAASCHGTCGQDLGACARSVTAAARTCVRDCRTADDVAACLRGCADAAQDGAATCAANFTACRTGCGGPTTTTTTLPGPASCEDSTAPACGGTCASGDQTCMPVGPSRCACVGGSVDGAFAR